MSEINFVEAQSDNLPKLDYFNSNSVKTSADIKRVEVSGFIITQYVVTSNVQDSYKISLYIYVRNNNFINNQNCH